MSAKPREVISIPEHVWKAHEGLFFLGQTPALPLGPPAGAWAALVNPYGSDIVVLTSVICVSNRSDDALYAKIVFAPSLPASRARSTFVTPSDIALEPMSRPKARILYRADPPEPISNGVEPLSRVVPPRSSVTVRGEGRWAFPPGTALAVVFEPLTDPAGSAVTSYDDDGVPTTPAAPADDQAAQAPMRGIASVSFEWWEEPIYYDDNGAWR